MKKILYILILLPILSFFMTASVSAADTESKESTWDIPDLQIPIPDLVFSQEVKCKSVDSATGQATDCEVPWIWEYIAAVYKYAVGIAGIVAVVVMMFGGFLWITAGGNTTTVETAKGYIGASLTGLLLVMFSYVILYNLNPELTRRQYIVLGDVKVDTAALYANEGFATGGGDASGSLSTFNTTQYDDTITAAAKKYNLDPALLKAIIKQESSFKSSEENPRTHAGGLTQLMPSTARSVGVTNVFDPEQSIYGGARYLRTCLNFKSVGGNIENALIAYNYGIGNYERVYLKTKYLPTETKNYITKVKTYQAQYAGKL